MVSIGPHHSGCGYPQSVCSCRNLLAHEVAVLRQRITALESAIHAIVDGMDCSTLGVQYTSLDNPLQRARAAVGEVEP